MTLDTDADGVADIADNCVDVPNGPLIPAACAAGIPQRNTDDDALGDSCDADDDNDGLADTAEDINENCAVDPGETDALNADTDGDGAKDGQDQYPLDPAQSGVRGDIDGNGVIGIQDLLLLQRALLGHITLDLQQAYRADVYPSGSGDDDLTISDLSELQKAALAP